MLTSETARPKRTLILSRQTLRRLDPVLHSITAWADGNKKSKDGEDGESCSCNCALPDPERRR
jgi:hypothetical protein